jgi:pyruvate-formate lyase
MAARTDEAEAPAPGEDMLTPAVDPADPFAAELAFTEVYRAHADAHVAVREAACLRTQYPGILEPIERDDLLAGRVRPRLVGFTPDEWGGCAFGYYHMPEAIRDALARYPLDGERRRAVEEMLAFWDEENTSTRLRHSYIGDMARWLPSDDWMNTSGIAFPLYRLCGGTVDLGTLVRLGIPGLAAEIGERRRGADDPQLFGAMLTALEVLAGVCTFYERQALALADDEPDEHRRGELRTMAGTLGVIACGAPATFREGLQLVWLYDLVADIRNHGRLDVTLGPFLARDLDEGRLSEAEALELVRSVLRLMAARRTRVHNRVIVGGLGRPNPVDADRFALLAIEASRTVLEPEPQLTLRMHEGMSAEVKAAALRSIGEGRTFPMLYNDDVNVPAVTRALNVDPTEAERYVPFGCGEYIIEHSGFGTPSGVINLAKALEVTLHDGIDPLSGERIGLSFGAFADLETFDELWSAYARQVEHFVRIMADHEALEYRVAAEHFSGLYLSMLYDDCLDRGRAIFDDGVRYLGGTLETYGNTTAADALTAIRRLVYEDRTLEPERLLAALDADFEGFDRERRMLQDAPKYGNDEDEPDAMLVQVDRHVCEHVEAQAARVGLHSYNVVIINNSANTLMGHWTAASADGRRSTTPLNNGNAPSSGNDRRGMTALLNSMVKPSPSVHAGAVQNLKLSPELFRTRLPETEALLDTYFERGGTQAMITVVSRGDLEAAMEHPERYRHIFVRVGGFSARFVDLSADVQLEIVQRTLY